jgi:trans-2,3-dihydro-3-hydroxyanthranilate isomerase
MFAPLSGTNEDPATGSAACALTGGLLLREPEQQSLTLSITQGVEMRRPSLMRCEARRIAGQVHTWVSGRCVPVSRGQVSV